MKTPTNWLDKLNKALNLNAKQITTVIIIDKY